MSPAQEADLILFWFQKKAKVSIESVGLGYIIDRFKKDDLDTLKIKLILEKLTEDNLLKEHKQPGMAPLYRITHSGYYSKGYINKENKEAISKVLQLLTTMVIAIGTGLTGVYALIQCGDSYSISIPLGTLVCTFLLGASLGAVIWALLSRKKSKDK